MIIAGAFKGTNDDVRYKPELFDRDSKHAVKYAVNWQKEYGPQLVRTKQAETFVDTKVSWLLGRPPVMVPGMTPYTVLLDFALVTMSTGYQIELASKLYPFLKSCISMLTKIGRWWLLQR